MRRSRRSRRRSVSVSSDGLRADRGRSRTCRRRSALSADLLLEDSNEEDLAPTISAEPRAEGGRARAFELAHSFEDSSEEDFVPTISAEFRVEGGRSRDFELAHRSPLPFASFVHLQHQMSRAQIRVARLLRTEEVLLQHVPRSESLEELRSAGLRVVRRRLGEAHGECAARGVHLLSCEKDFLVILAATDRAARTHPLALYDRHHFLS